MQGRVTYRFGRFTLDPADERLTGPGGPVRLGHKAYRVLLTLVEQQGRLVTKDSLFESVWDGTIVSESALTSVIKELRRALGDDARAPAFIESAYGRGYRFLGGAEQAPSDAAPVLATASAVSRGESQRPPLLVVLPLDDGAVRSSHPFLASGIRAELLLALSRLREIRLVAGTERLPQLSSGQTLSERDYQLQLTLLAHGEDVRIFVNISSLSTNLLLWSDTAELGREQGRGVERLIRRIVSEGLSRLYKDVLRSAPAEPDGIYDRYFANQLRMRAQRNLTEAQSVAAEWEAIIAAEPEFGPAYPPLIRLYNTDFCYTGLGSSDSAKRARADQLADTLLLLDPYNSHSLTLKGFCCLWAGRSNEAKENFDLALERNPYHQARLVELSTGYAYLDDLNRAEELLREHDALAPFSIDMPHENFALLHLLKEEYDLAQQQGALTRRNHPEDLAQSAPSVFGQLYTVLGAAGEGSEDLPAQAEEWFGAMRRRWSSQEPFCEEGLLDWIRFHVPLQATDRRSFVLALAEKVFAALN